MGSLSRVFNGLIKLKDNSLILITGKQCASYTTASKPLTQLSEDELLMKESVSKLAVTEILPKVRKMEDEEKIDEGVLSSLFANGLMGVEIEEEYGGSGCSFMSSIIVVEELAKVDPAVTVLVDIQNTLINSLFRKLGTSQQKQTYLPKLAQNTVGSFCLSEANSGSDAFSLKTTATQDGDDYIINGAKMWISNSDLAEVFLVMANANPSAGYRGITTFIVDRNTPGLSIGKKEKKLGMSASGTCMVYFDNVRVPKNNILGEFGKGYVYAASFLNEGRIGIGAQMVGLAQGCLDATIKYTLERKQFGQEIFAFQSIKHDIAKIATEIEAARLLVYNAARKVEAGEPFIQEASMAKYFSSGVYHLAPTVTPKVAQRTTIKCIDWMGGVGFTRDYLQEKFYRDVKIGTIYEGTTNMQLETIAKYIRKQYS